jgi:Flp pilus assembly pilin Flp
MDMNDLLIAQKKRQRGAATVEFALVALVFFAVLIGVMEFGRWLFTLNSVAEATRWGARTAVVCDMDASAIKNNMKLIARGLTDSMIGVVYEPAGCTESGALSCERVKVGVGSAAGASDDYNLSLLFPFKLNVAIPSFSTTLPTESLESLNNPVCELEVPGP